jgi:Tol biopolymer transport system component
MKKILYLLFLVSFNGFAQLPDTDIFLAKISANHGKLSFGTPFNITNRTGYDNQPSFTPDGKSVLFVSVKDTTQSDVYSYELSSKKISQLTATDESEYSPSCTNDRKNISVVRVDKDNGQRFYNIPANDIKNPHVVKGGDSIGYYCWLNDSLVAMFILGPANTFQVLNTHTAQRKLIAGDIGRCMKLDADKKNMLFVIKQNENEWSIFRMNIASFAISKVTSTLKGSEDFAVMSDGTLLTGSEGKLFSYMPNVDKDWQQIADFTSTVKTFYRISVSPKNDFIALVAYTGKKP